MSVIPFPIGRREGSPFSNVTILASASLEMSAAGLRIAAADLRGEASDMVRARLIGEAERLEDRAFEIDCSFGFVDPWGAA